jgi:hypothetical protein
MIAPSGQVIRTSRMTWLVVLAACTGKSEPPAAPPPPVVIADAGVDGITTIGTYDPASGMHLDDDQPGRPPPHPAAPRASHPIDVILRSTPPNAHAAVDGVPIGTTPTYWAGDANGREHQFTFVLPGYAVARYRFVPITSGVVHAHLDPVTDNEPDAGVSPDMSPPVTPPVSPSVSPTRHQVPTDAYVPIDANSVGEPAVNGPQN